MKREKNLASKTKRNNQLTGNVGLYYVCYLLSRKKWNVLPTSRNAKGVDILIYSQNLSRRYAIQVKSLSKRNAINIGKSNKPLPDYLVVCRKVWDDKPPEVFVMSFDDAKTMVEEKGKTKKSYWLQYKDYEKFRDDMCKRIGNG